MMICLFLQLSLSKSHRVENFCTTLFWDKLLSFRFVSFAFVSFQFVSSYRMPLPCHVCIIYWLHKAWPHIRALLYVFSSTTSMWSQVCPVVLCIPTHPLVLLVPYNIYYSMHKAWLYIRAVLEIISRTTSMWSQISCYDHFSLLLFDQDQKSPSKTFYCIAYTHLSLCMSSKNV